MTDSADAESTSLYSDSYSKKCSIGHGKSFNSDLTLVDSYLTELVQEQIDFAVLEASFVIVAVQREKDGHTIKRLAASENDSWLKKFNWRSIKCHLSILQMFSCLSVICSLIHLILIFFRANSLIREPPMPSPFFKSTNGTVQDFYDGAIHPQLLMARAEFTVVFLYAPWDNRSKQFRQPFYDVATLFRHTNSVKFIAVNCYYFRGQCKRMFKLHSFPVIFAYNPYGQPIVFNQVFSSIRLFSWIFHLLNPLQRIYSSEELRIATISSDFLVVGHFSFEFPWTLPRSYHVFLNAAYKASHLRPSLSFAILSNASLALNHLEFTDSDQLIFYSFYNEHHDRRVATFNIDHQTKSADVIDWINKLIGDKYSFKAVNQIELEDLEAAGKSEEFFQKLNSTNATLVLFTSMLGMFQSQNQITLKNFVKLFQHCHQSAATPFMTQSHDFFRNDQKICALPDAKLNLCCDHFLKINNCKQSVDSEQRANIDDHCQEVTSLLKESFKHRCCSRPKMRRNRTIIFGTFLSWEQRLKCSFFNFLKTQHKYVYWELLNSSNLEEGRENDLEQIKPPHKWLIGAGCRLNKTLGFLAIDKHFGSHFMRKWGLSRDVLASDALAIVVREEERIFFMDKTPIDIGSLAAFIDGFFNNSLIWIPKNQLIHNSDSKYSEEDEYFAESVLNRLNRQRFFDHILNSKNRTHDAVIFFSAGDWHGPSTSVLHLFHKTSHYFSEYFEFIRFYTIDMSQNVLDWKFDFHQLPSIGFFSALRPKETFIFHDQFAVTVPNLLGFILPRCQERLRWLLAFSVCRENCLVRNEHKLLRIIRRTRNDIRTLQKMLRKIFAEFGFHPTVPAVQHVRTLLRRRKLQKAVLLHLLNCVNALQRRNATKSTTLESVNKAMFANWILTSKLGIRFNIS